LFAPENPLAPRGPVFDEAWQAQVLAMADAMVQAGHITASHWATALGAALRDADANGAPDTADTYYTAALSALEGLAARAGIDTATQQQRKADWEAAYLRTPHGQPVKLTD